MSRRSGKVSVTLVVVVAFVLGLGVMALSTSENPATAGARFMAALARGDYKTLAELSYGDGVSREEFEKEWQYTMEVAAPHYQFNYEIRGESQTTPTSAVVKMMYTRNAGAAGSYEEPYQLPMVKTEDGWKVDVFSLDRDMFPGLPR
jgi:hypothetical protein